MKKTAILLGPTLALTVAFYLLCFYLLPGPPPSQTMVVLLAGLALTAVWVVQRLCLLRKANAPSPTPRTVAGAEPPKVPITPRPPRSTT